MKINYFKVNGYGKIIDKEIKLNENVNIIHGKNEAGKSTMLSFIKSMFYGASKNKNGKDISDFDKYKPWETENFSGKIKYTLDNNEEYEIYREFKKKNPIIYNKNLKDISNNFSNDKSTGINFLNEKIGIDEEIFGNTVITSQDEIKISKAGQNSIIQRISNLVSSGDETVSFKRTLEKIVKQQNEQVGTNRTTQKPINILENKIKDLEKEKTDLETYKKSAVQNEFELVSIKNEIDRESEKLVLLKRYKEETDKDKIYFAEINANKELEISYKNKIEELNKKLDNSEEEKKQKDKKSFTKNYILILFFTIISIITFAVGLFIAVPIILLIADIICIAFTIKNKVVFNNEQKEKLDDIEEYEARLKQETEIMRKNLEEIQDQKILKEREMNNNREEAREKIKNEFVNKLDINFIENVFDMNYDEVPVSVTTKEERINDLKMQLYSKENEKQYMSDKLDSLAKIQEELICANEEKEELVSLNNSFNIVKECMQTAYEKIRESLSPVFTEELCNLISKITNGKYNKLKFSDTDGLTVEIDDGRYISAENLSIGTIDQMYLALRFSTLKAVSKENMPIILDEAFAYFDDERLKNILLFINKNYRDKQIIIFTCSNREKEILNKLYLKYNLVEI